MSEPMDSSQLTPPSRYWAFISYSHKDKSWGRWLHRSIETYGIPAELVGQHRIPSGHFAPKRFYQTFRDREELAASASLGEEIDKALRDSHYLIIICSPNAAQSKWVNQEVSTFQRLGRASQIFAVIVDGEPNTGDARECFPPALKRQEVIAADARPEGDGKNDAKLKLLAGMLGVSFDTLKKRDARRALRRMQVTVMFSLMLVLAFAALSLAIFQAKKSAESALRVSVAKTLAAQSFVESDRHLDLALLLCDKAESVDSNPETRSALYHVLQKCNRLDRFLWEKNDGVSESTEIEEIKFSPDGHTAAGACYDGKVALWNMDKPEDPAQIIMSKKDQFTTLAFNDEGTQLAAGGGEDVGVSDYNIYLYDLRKQMVIAKLEGATNPITAINFSADGKKLVSASADNIILWDLATTRAEWQFTVTNAIPSGYFNSKGQFVIFTEGDFVVCDAGLHQIIRHEKLPPNNWVFKSALCPSKGAAALLSDNNLLFMDLNTMSNTAQIPLQSPFGDSAPRAFAINKDASTAVFNRGNSMFIIDMNGSGATEIPMKYHGGDLISMAFHPNKDLLLTTAKDNRVALCDLENTNMTTLKSFETSQNSLVKFDYLPNSNLIAAYGDKQISYWNMDSLKMTGDVWTNDDFGGTSCAFSRDGQLVAIPNQDRTAINVYSTKDRTTRFHLEQPNKKAIYGLAFSADAKQLVEGSEDNAAELWDLTQSPPQPTRIIQHQGTVYDVAVSPDGQWVASASGDRTVGFYNLQKQSGHVFPALHDASVIKLAFSPDGKYLASASDDATVGIWSMKPSPLFMMRLAGPNGGASSVTFSSDGSILACGGGDGSVKLWDAKTWTPYPQPLTFPNNPVTMPHAFSMVFTPDNKHLISSAGNGSILFYDLDSTSLRQLARKLANRDFTFSEKNEYFGSYPPELFKQP